MKNTLLLFLMLFSIHSYATDVSGGIYSNTTWTLSSSPYVVTSDVVVFNDVELTIEPGVEIRFNNNCRIEVRGRIVARGTPTARIVFRGNVSTNTPGYWKGIVFIGTVAPLGSGSQATFRHCNFSDAEYCLDFNTAYHGPYVFRNCSFTYNRYINDDGGLGGMLFDSCTVKHNYTGFTYFQFGGVISNSVFDDNEYGVDGSDTLIGCTFTNHSKIAAQPYGYTNGCIITNNNQGVWCGFNSVNHTFINNKVKDNTEGIYASFFPGVNFKGNEICNNSSYNIKLGGGNNADLSQNCWCTTDSAAIRSKIIDGYVDISKGLVTFNPIRTVCTSTVFVQQIATVEDVEIYPNPATVKGWLHIRSAAGFTHSDIELTDVLGRQYLCEVHRNSDKLYSVQLPDCAPGIYMLTITGGESGRLTRMIDVR